MSVLSGLSVCPMRRFVLTNSLRVVQSVVSRPVNFQQHANMATLKEIQMRLKSITNIAKITKSMKMIASTKVQRAQRTLESSRVLQAAITEFPKKIFAPPFPAKPDLILVISSDRGLCGGIHTTLSRSTRKIMRGSYPIPQPEERYMELAPVSNLNKEEEAAAAPSNTGIVIIGDKVRTQLSRDVKKNITLSFSQSAKGGPSFEESLSVADKILLDERLAGFRSGVIVYNRFKSAIAYETDVMQLHSRSTFTTLGCPALLIYKVSPQVLRHYFEFQLAASIFCAVAEGYASEITARRAAMDNATKNAGDIISKLTMSYNRQRQAAITNDLVDIITGASAV